MLTTQTGITATETIHTDLRPVNRVLPNGQVLSEDAQILLDKSIVAKPLGIPAQEEIRIKNTAFKYRWVNRQSMGGSWFRRMTSVGWTLAKTEDVEPLSCELTNDNGELRMFDVVLMKIPVEKYQGAMKHNMQRALFLMRDKRFLTGKGDETPSTDVNSNESAVVHKASEVDANAGDGKYITTFDVSDTELDAKMGKDTKAGRK